MELTRMFVTRKFVKIVAAWMIVTAAMLGVCAQCTEGGTYQGGGDSEPHYRH